ncbi:D-isomer specific 2-hydroxyacid dehydrogenase NAD-binding protein [Pseudodesulfovibrio mercurii]|uniref:D-isomer specific 2-hydroxyacid dehydrogenase NAD-binding protein n=1 Tax=Pseudodesulfovibrio mercurii TaxID=641491 RepID=F0JJU3_9BACT|nr:D-glycerate dehydrogenase [Pseudodesulfovibrio mercurii]EGB16192.1 D-isomer specific 2-hydroxyacid dehydrogenase NAD-binding protein [Pseudodesulfovibrio mercurii]
MARPKVYITREIPRAGIDLLRQAADVEVNTEDRPVTREELFERIADCQGVIGLLTERIDAAFFDAAPGLKGYANYAVGFDNIDVPEATRRKLPVSNTPDVLTNATAECAWALLLAVARRVVESDAVMRSGDWPGWGPMQFIGGDVSGKTLGIVGAGRIGTAMARMSRGFDMPVLYTSSSGRRNAVLDAELNARLVPFEELLEQSDFISLHTPLTPSTRHLFGAEAFRRMKRTAYLVNTARGPVIDEQALLAALRAGEIAGAGLDVYEHEPALTPGLAELTNVVLLPHIGSGTASARTDMSVLAARNLLAMLEGKKPETCLNPEIYD